MTIRRARSLDAATVLIGRHGDAAASIDGVTNESRLVGMSRIYHQFCGKQELGFEVLNRQFERCAERGLAILRGRMTDPIERSSLLVDALVAAHAELGCSFRSPFCELAAEIADAHKGLRIRIAQVFVR